MGAATPTLPDFGDFPGMGIDCIADTTGDLDANDACRLLRESRNCSVAFGPPGRVSAFDESDFLYDLLCHFLEVAARIVGGCRMAADRAIGSSEMKNRLACLLGHGY